MYETFSKKIGMGENLEDLGADGRLILKIDNIHMVMRESQVSLYLTFMFSPTSAMPTLEVLSQMRCQNLTFEFAIRM
jgi:hypothetical protein